MFHSQNKLPLYFNVKISTLSEHSGKIIKKLPQLFNEVPGTYHKAFCVCLFGKECKQMVFPCCEVLFYLFIDQKQQKLCI